MEKSRINAERLSGRQLSVALMVAGLSPAATLAGRASWPWLVFWCGVGVAMAWLTLRRLGDCPVFQGKPGVILSILYKVGAVLLAARVLSRASERLEITSGGSPGFWLTLIIAAPLLWMCWGKAAWSVWEFNNGHKQKGRFSKPSFFVTSSGCSRHFCKGHRPALRCRTLQRAPLP